MTVSSRPLRCERLIYVDVDLTRPGRPRKHIFTYSQASFLTETSSSHVPIANRRSGRRHRKVIPKPPFRTGETAISFTLYTGGTHLSILMRSDCLRRSSICETHYLIMRYAVQVTASLTNPESQVDETESAAKIVCHLPVWALCACQDRDCWHPMIDKSVYLVVLSFHASRSIDKLTKNYHAL